MSSQSYVECLIRKDIIIDIFNNANLLTKIVYDYNTFDSLDIDRFRYSAIFIMYIKACGEKSFDSL